MKDYLYIGPTPSDESCVQVGDENYREKATIELDAFINQLYRHFGQEFIENNGIYLKKKWNSHDFGTYGEIVVVFDDSNDESVNAAFHIESNCPENWDEDAVIELEKAFETLLEMERIGK